MANDKIVIRGAREHNLKNDALSTGRHVYRRCTVSGESNWWCISTNSSAVEASRQLCPLLGRMDKPDVDEITGLSPAISIDQKTTSHNPRSTVGTVTEIYDYLRLLYAGWAHVHCPVRPGDPPADRR